MRIIKIVALDNGGHLNQTSNDIIPIPDGWALIPDDVKTPNFPYGDITVKDIYGTMTVTSWTPRPIPEPEPVPEPEPSANELLDILLGVTE